MPSFPQQDSVAEGFDLSQNDAQEDTALGGSKGFDLSRNDTQEDTTPSGGNEHDGIKEESEMKWNYS